ncbi:Kremen protein 1 [Elsinoe australis]|uniref:Kremen protein 1 n=1 Tax=Elsinoe australis TaxID=40998 RepID=A0A2P7ZQ48_9PEZI|nr:Kremen protein 1 [Elsinoe australis]
MKFTLSASILAGLSLIQPITAQQFAGDVIPNKMPTVPGSELAYWRVTDPAGKNNALTLINYWSQNGNGQRLVNSDVQRGVIIIHGLNRDPGTYMSNMLSALSQTTPNDPNVNFKSVQIIAPLFSNGNDKNIAYPWTDGLKAGRGSVSNALVWAGSQWSAGANNQYPWNATSVSSFEVLDQLIKWFDDRTRYPNMKQIVVAGHSLGGQTVNRYAEIGNPLATKSPVTYWIGNPNSYTWMATSRPLDTSTCPTYDTYRDGFFNFTSYPMTYASSLVASGRSAVLANYNSKSKAYARGTQDLGDDSSSCAPFTQGANRNERFFNFIKAFPASCANPANGQCDTIDYVNAGHDGGAMMASPAGQARLFLDNFYGDGKRAYDFGYPRLQTGDDPLPDPNQNATQSTDKTVYAGNMTSAGCWTDNARNQRSLPYQAFDSQTASIESCTAACAAAGYSIAGLEFGSQCFCGNSLGPYAQQTIAAGCTQPCAGNSSQVCGNGNRLSLYSNGTPSQSPLPGMPETVGNYNALLCYTEATSGRALSAKGYTDGTNMTLENCASYCNGYKYFGVEFGAECYCGSFLGDGSVVTADTDCSMTCPGNSRELCGAGNRLTVYQLDSSAPVSTITQGSTTTTSATATSGASSAASTSTIPSASLCPSADGQTVGSYSVKCSSDSSVGAYTGVSASSSYLDCMTACDAQASSGCKGFVYVGGDNGSGSGTCWLKSDIGSFTPSGSNFIAAVKASAGTSPIASSSTVSGSTSAVGSSSASTVSSTSTVAAQPTTAISCPTNNNTIYTATTGATFLIECGIDHYGGDIAATGVSSFAGCIEACATNSKCVDVSLSGSACYLKGTLGDAIQNGGILGAKLVTSISSTTTTTVSSSASPVVNFASTTLSTVTTSTTTSAVSSSLTTSATTTSSTTTTTLVTSTTTSTTSAVPTSSPSPSTPSATTTTVAPVVAAPSSTPTTTTTTISTPTTLSTIALTSSSTTSTTTTTTTSTTTTATTSSAPTPLLPSGITPLGCYTDISPRTFPLQLYSNSTNTPTQCALACRASGYKYSGTEYSSECWCSNAAPTTSPVGSCTMPCAGDKSQICGGANRLSVAVDSNWVQTFFARQSYGVWSSLGCYTDGVGGRTLGQGLTPLRGGAGNATVANCLDACAAAGLGWCGVEYYSECYGAKTAPKAELALSGDVLANGCSFKCKGNSSEACGGANRVQVFVLNGTTSGV